uniref:Uncharacterized protein n=1 Tax=Anguilla anguilla TaxID=7936 RepID=A0A0E9SI88_ANGAN
MFFFIFYPGFGPGPFRGKGLSLRVGWSSSCLWWVD